MMTENSFIGRLINLLEESDLEQPFYCLDTDETLENVLEVSIPSDMKHGDVWYCRISYNNITKGLDPGNPDKEWKDRRCIIINDNEFGFIAMRCSSVKDRDKNGNSIPRSVIEKRYNTNEKYILLDWAQEGFVKETYAYISEIRRIKDITHIDLNVGRIGHITKNDLNEVISKFNYFKSSRYDILKLFNTYLKFSRFKYNRSGCFQSIMDIDKSNTVSLVDVANIAANICHKMGIKYRILYTKVETSNSEFYHFTCIYRNNVNIFAFRYFPDLPGLAEIHMYSSTKDFDSVIDKENNWIWILKNPVPNAVNCESRFLTKDEFNLWIKFSKNHEKVFAFINGLKIFSKISKLNSELNTFRYDDKINYDKYKTGRLGTFELHKKGNCWDFVMFQQRWFRKNMKDVKRKTWLIESGDGNFQTHSWMSIYLDNDSDVPIVLESPLQSFKGIHVFKNDDEMINEYYKQASKNWKHTKLGFVVYEFDKDHDFPADKTVSDIAKFCLKYGKIAFKKGKYYKLITEPSKKYLNEYGTFNWKYYVQPDIK